MAQAQEVKVGQVWKDRDWRVRNRFVRVIVIDGEKAICQQCNDSGISITHRVTKILLRRFRPTSTGYDLVTL